MVKDIGKGAWATGLVTRDRRGKVRGKQGAWQGECIMRWLTGNR